jgi:hypothetical protein
LFLKGSEMIFSQIEVGKSYEGEKGAVREVIAKCPNTNIITYTENGKEGKMPGQKFAREWAKRVKRDRTNDKPKQERRANN